MKYRVLKDFKLGSEDLHNNYRKDQVVDDSEFSVEMIDQKLIPLGWIEPIEPEPEFKSELDEVYE